MQAKHSYTFLYEIKLKNDNVFFTYANRNHLEGNMIMLKMVTIGGGSSYTPELIEGLLARREEFPVDELWLVDIESGREKLEIIGDFARRMVKKKNANLKIYTTCDRREALSDADFVTTQIRVGGMAARIKDETISFKHDTLGQETNAAGGLLNAMRTIPVMLAIAQDIAELCPDAWLINFTNPAGMVTEALLRYGAHKRVIGLCNVPIHMEHMWADILGVDASRLRINFAGLNHMVFGLNLYIDGIDKTKEAIAVVTAPDFKELPTMRNIIPAKLDKAFLRGLGVIPCPYHNYFFHAKEMYEHGMETYHENNVHAAHIANVEKELFEIYKDPSVDEKPIQLEQRGGAFYSDAACRLMNSIYNDKRDIQPVDTRNGGSIWGLEEDSAVEVSCVITKEGPIPLTIGHLPYQINGLVQEIKSFERASIEAAVSGSYEKALVALTINPLIPSDSVARALLDELMEAHRDYLPLFFD